MSLPLAARRFLSTAPARRPLPSLPAALGRRPASSSSGTAIVAPQDQQAQIVPTQEELANDVQLAGLGYPQMPQVSRQLRPAKGNWWDRQERINYNEILPENDDTLSMWAPDVHKKPAHLAAAQIALMSGVLASFAAFVWTIQPELPAAKRKYPYDGLVKELSGTDDQAYAAVVKGTEVSSGEDEEEE